MNLSLSRGNRSARVWLDEMPDLIYAASRTGEREVAPRAPGIREHRTAALELRIPAGEFFLNGTLGAQFDPEPVGRLLVVAAISDHTTARLRPMEFQSIGGVKTGLREEFARAVLDGALARPETPSFGPGRLIFNRSSYGALGSTPALFRRLAETVVRLLHAYPVCATPADLEAIIGL